MKAWISGLGVVCLALGVVSAAGAAEHTVKMLNTGEDGSMVFEPGYLNVEVGDTVLFEPTNSGHHVRSLALPEGEEKWDSALDQPFRVTIGQEGLYVYYCPPHLMNAMFGIIQAGAPVNIEQAEKVVERNRGRMFLDPKRVDAIWNAVER